MSSLSAYRRANAADVLDSIEKDYPDKPWKIHTRATVRTLEPSTISRGGVRFTMPDEGA
jgi:hypothetical protein